MAFGNITTDQTRVYKFGARIGKDDFKEAHEILFKSNCYRNRLIELELERRASVDNLLRELSPDLPLIENQITSVEAEIEKVLTSAKANNQVNRKKNANSAEKLALKTFKDSRKDLWAKRKDLRSSLFKDPIFIEKNEKIEEDNKAKRKEARANCGIFWGTYLTVETARQGDRKGPPPRFHRFESNGRIAVQIQGGIPITKLYDGTGTIIQLDPKPVGSSGNPWRKGRIRIGSDDNSKPKWLEFQVKIHRDIPDDAVVKWAWLNARKVGTHVIWSLQLSLARKAWDDPRRCLEEGVIAVDIGWRKIPEGLRVAYWLDDSGKEGQVIIPQWIIDRQKKVEDLQSIRDKNFNTIKTVLSGFQKTTVFPEWLQDKLKSLSNWESQARLASVIIAWRVQRFVGDENLYGTLEAWRKQDKHLYDWEEAQRKSVQEWRLNLYREFACKISREYRVAVIEDIDWRDFAKLPDIFSDETVKEAVRWNNKLAAVSYLLNCIKAKMTECLKAPPEWTTQACNKCGQIDNFDAEKELIHTCSKCGATWDQDANACRNLLTRYASGAVIPAIAKAARSP